MASKAKRRRPAARRRVVTSADAITRQLAMSALAKRAAGQTPGERELRALRRVEREQQEEFRADCFRSVRKAEWCEWSGRDNRVVNEQGRRFGVRVYAHPIDLAEVAFDVHALFERLGRRGVLQEDEQGATSEARERLLRVRAAREEFRHEQEMGQWLSRREVREAFTLIAVLLRRAGENLQRVYGDDAGAILEEGLAAAEREFARKFGGNHERDDGRASIDGPD